MIRKNFDTKLAAEEYLTKEKIRLINGYLTRSERDELKLYLDKPELLVSKKETIKSIGLPIITDRKLLSQPCVEVVPEDDVKTIVKNLKDALRGKAGALGLSAPQIGIQKRICYISIPSINKEKKAIEYQELVLINPKIIEQSTPIRVNGEGCVSFPGIRVDTLRYVYCIIEYLDENFKLQTKSAQDLESFAIQHEIDHLNGITIFDRKWRTE